MLAYGLQGANKDNILRDKQWRREEWFSRRCNILFRILDKFVRSLIMVAYDAYVCV